MHGSADATPSQRATATRHGRRLATVVGLLAVLALLAVAGGATAAASTAAAGGTAAADGTATADGTAVAGGTAASDALQQENQTVDYDSGAQFEFTSPQLAEMPFGPQDPVVELGDDFALGTTVTNAGDEAGTRPVVFAPQVDCENLPEDQLPVAQRLVELEPGESTDVAFYCDVPADGEPTTNDPLVGVRNVAEEATVLSPSATYDWDAEQYPDGFEVVAPMDPPSVAVDGVTVDGSPQVGAEVTVAVAVNNTGGPGSTSVELAVEGEAVDRVDGEVDRAAQSVVPLTYTPGPGEWGTQNWTVSAGDDTATGTVEVSPQPFTIDIVDAPSTAAAGETVEVDVRVTNDGDAKDVHPVALEGGGTATDGSLVGLEAGSSTTVTLSGTIAQDATGTVEVSAVGPTDAASTSVAIGTDDAPVTVSVESVRDPVMPAAEQISVEANVTNAGSTAVTRTVDLSVDGTVVASRDVEVAAGATSTVSLVGDVDPTAGDELAVTVATDGASDGRTVDVAPPLDVTIDGEYEPRPYGEDGLYRDLDGDGEIGQRDVAILFDNMIFPVIQDNWEYFDFTGDGAFGQQDVADLFRYIVLG